MLPTCDGDSGLHLTRFKDFTSLSAPLEPLWPPAADRRLSGAQQVLTGSPLHDHHHAFPIGRRLHAHSLAVNQPVVAERVASLQVVGLLGRRTHRGREAGKGPAGRGRGASSTGPGHEPHLQCCRSACSS